MAQRVTYCTSHDVEGTGERRLYSFYLDLVRGQWDDARRRLGFDPADVTELETLAREMIVSSFALMLTCRGIPMFLAGEEFGDLHDLEPGDWRRKMSDPVDWYRRYEPGHSRVLKRVAELVALRTRRDVVALQRNEIEFFGLNGIAPGFQADFDENAGGRVFAYCRTGGRARQAPGQIVVVANCGWQQYPRFTLDWPWSPEFAVREHGGRGQAPPAAQDGELALELDRFQVRVFEM
jgi:1,4-alpha-glucan branching enzyme